MNTEYTTWTEATDGLTNNERGVLWALIHGMQDRYGMVQRTSDAWDDVRTSYRRGTNINDEKQIRKALLGLEAKGIITITPRTGVIPGTTYGIGYDWRDERNGTPMTYYYRADMYAAWRAGSVRAGRYSRQAKWYQVAHFTVTDAARLRQAIVNERDGVQRERDDARLTAATKRVESERDRLDEFMGTLLRYADTYRDGSLPVQPAPDYRRNDDPDATVAAAILRDIANQAKDLANWFDRDKAGAESVIAECSDEREEVAA